MNIACRLLGHKTQMTFVINSSGDTYEVEDAEYCNRCGMVERLYERTRSDDPIPLLTPTTPPRPKMGRIVFRRIAAGFPYGLPAVRSSG